uniref:Secreted protein n=1 Tax=Ascaris lumbricoides TaxID=6252 RepID=A0A0M3HVV6_ASCLU
MFLWTAVTASEQSYMSPERRSLVTSASAYAKSDESKRLEGAPSVHLAAATGSCARNKQLRPMLPGVCVQSTATRRGTQRVDGAAQHCTNAVATALGHAPGCMHVLPQRRRQTFGGTLRRKRFNQLLSSDLFLPTMRHLAAAETLIRIGYWKEATTMSVSIWCACDAHGPTHVSGGRVTLRWLTTPSKEGTIVFS